MNGTIENIQFPFFSKMLTLSVNGPLLRCLIHCITGRVNVPCKWFWYNINKKKWLVLLTIKLNGQLKIVHLSSSDFFTGPSKIFFIGLWLSMTIPTIRIEFSSDGASYRVYQCFVMTSICRHKFISKCKTISSNSQQNSVKIYCRIENW